MAGLGQSVGEVNNPGCHGPEAKLQGEPEVVVEVGEGPVGG